MATKNPANTSDMAPFANPNEYPNNATVESVGEHCLSSKKRDRPLPVFRDKKGPFARRRNRADLCHRSCPRGRIPREKAASTMAASVQSSLMSNASTA